MTALIIWTGDDPGLSRTLAEAGLPGWRGVIRACPEATGRRVAVLTSPDYSPAPPRGRLVIRRGHDDADAFALALTAAKGPLQ